MKAMIKARLKDQGCRRQETYEAEALPAWRMMWPGIVIGCGGARPSLWAGTWEWCEDVEKWMKKRAGLVLAAGKEIDGQWLLYMSCCGSAHTDSYAHTIMVCPLSKVPWSDAALLSWIHQRISVWHESSSRCHMRIRPISTRAVIGDVEALFLHVLCLIATGLPSLPRFCLFALGRPPGVVLSRMS